MAHADYTCCAICDCKQDYVGMNDSFKGEICIDCLRTLHNLGYSDVYDTRDLISLLKNLNKKQTIDFIKGTGFCPCWYENAVDTQIANNLKIKPNKFTKDYFDKYMKKAAK